MTFGLLELLNSFGAGLCFSGFLYNAVTKNKEMAIVLLIMSMLNILAILI